MQMMLKRRSFDVDEMVMTSMTFALSLQLTYKISRNLHAVVAMAQVRATDLIKPDFQKGLADYIP